MKKNNSLSDLISQLSINSIMKKNYSTFITSFTIKDYLFINKINVNKLI